MFDCATALCAACRSRLLPGAVCGLMLLVLLLGDTALAVTPWEKLTLFKQIDADPNKEYALTEDQGPWMIMAATFTGREAEKQSRALVLELRSAYKLPAYSYKMHFDHQATTGRGVDRYGAPRKMKYLHNEELNEIGVLVGNYPANDDPEAQKTLKRLKYTTPKCMDVKALAAEGREVAPPLAGWRWLVENKFVPETERRGPMGHAFIISNPLVPNEYFKPRGLDKLVVSMNKPLKYSLLYCPGKYTVKVATYTGRTVSDPGEIQAIEKGKKIDSQLEAAEVKAHQLCEALRAKGYEAYEFHDRYSSMVTVGSFDSVGSPRADGKIEINPQVHAIMETFGAEKSVAGASAPAVGRPKNIGNLPLDVQPLPVEVPRAGIDVTGDRSLFGQR
jgi:hypothetical protein